MGGCRVVAVVSGGPVVIVIRVEEVSEPALGGELWVEVRS